MVTLRVTPIRAVSSPFAIPLKSSGTFTSFTLVGRSLVSLTFNIRQLEFGSGVVWTASKRVNAPLESSVRMTLTGFLSYLPAPLT